MGNDYLNKLYIAYMPDKICPGCEQVVPRKRLDYLTNLRKTIVEYYSESMDDCEWSPIELTVRIDGEVVEVVRPEAFDLISAN